jgi:hypothetical protein
LNFKVLFIYPLDNGLKSYIKLDDEIYFITFLTEKNNAEFTIYSKNQSDELLKESKIRQEILNRFVLFLKQNKEKIKVGVYFDNSEEMYKEIFQLHSIEKLNNGFIQVSFSILDESYTISNLRIIKNKDKIMFDDTYTLYKHDNENCFCENIKHKHDISDFEHCLVLIEHQDVILEWIKKEYRRRFIPQKSNKIIQFPKK